MNLCAKRIVEQGVRGRGGPEFVQRLRVGETRIAQLLFNWIILDKAGGLACQAGSWRPIGENGLQGGLLSGRGCTCRVGGVFGTYHEARTKFREPGTKFESLHGWRLILGVWFLEFRNWGGMQPT